MKACSANFAFLSATVYNPLKMKTFERKTTLTEGLKTWNFII
jgi:hypothetical protein